jgi:hypothetical protein
MNRRVVKCVACLYLNPVRLTSLVATVREDAAANPPSLSIFAAHTDRNLPFSSLRFGALARTISPHL